MDVAPAAAEAAVEAGAVVEAACVQQYAAAVVWVRQQAACMCAAAGGGGRGNDCAGRHAASQCACSSGQRMWRACNSMQRQQHVCSSGRQRLAAQLQWDTVMAAASRRHNSDGQQRQLRCKGQRDGGKIAMNNNYSNWQLWVKAGIGGRSG